MYSGGQFEPTEAVDLTGSTQLAGGDAGGDVSERRLDKKPRRTYAMRKRDSDSRLLTL
jgi:hypothetical protein